MSQVLQGGKPGCEGLNWVACWAEAHEEPTFAFSMLIVAVAAEGTRMMGTPPLLRADADASCRRFSP